MALALRIALAATGGRGRHGCFMVLFRVRGVKSPAENGVVNLRKRIGVNDFCAMEMRLKNRGSLC